MGLLDLPQDLVSRCLANVSAKAIMEIFVPASKFCCACASDEDLWEHLFHIEKNIGDQLRLNWRSKVDSWRTTYRLYSQNQWLHGIWWLEESSSQDKHNGWRPSRGGLLQIVVNSEGLLGELIRPTIADDHQPMGLGLMGQELVHVRSFDTTVVMEKKICEYPDADSRFDFNDNGGWQIFRGSTNTSAICYSRGDIRFSDSESVMQSRCLQRFQLRRSTDMQSTPEHEDSGAIPRCLSWVRVLSYEPTASKRLVPPSPLDELCGVWMGEYGSHGLQLLLLSREVAALTPLHPAPAPAREADGSMRKAERGAVALPSVDLVALKLTGDPNVPAGQVSFCVSASTRSTPYSCRCCYQCACPGDEEPPVGAVYAAQLQTAQHGYHHPRWNAAEVAPLHDGTLLLIWTGMHSRRLRRVGLPGDGAARLAAAVPLRAPPDAPPPP